MCVCVYEMDVCKCIAANRALWSWSLHKSPLCLSVSLFPCKQYILWHKKSGQVTIYMDDSMGSGLKRDTSLQFIYWTGRGFSACGARKKSRRGSLMWQQRNNNVVLELWIGMLAGFLCVYPSAVEQLYSRTDIKLSLPHCNNATSL